MKKALAILLLLSLFLACACKSTSYTKEKLTLSYSQYEMPASKPATVTLYYPASDNTHVLAFTQQLTYEDSLYEGIMNALLSGTPEGYVSPFPQGVTSRSIMLLEDILYVDMSWQFAQMPAEKLFACLSVMASTFTGLSEISFINVTVEGKQLTMPQLPERPIMLLSSYSGTVKDLIDKHKSLLEQNANGQKSIESFYGVIYDADETKKYIVPSAASITVKDGDYASQLISNLLAKSSAIFPSGFMLKESPTYEAASNRLCVELICPEDWQYQSDWLGPYAIACTLNAIYSDMRRLSLTVKNPDGDEKFALDSDTSKYYDRIRASVQVITPDSSGTGLTNTTMLLSNMPGGNLREFLNEYLCLITPEFRRYESIINDVIVSNDTVVIDISKDYYDYFSDEKRPSTQQEEYAIIYSLIATACKYSGTSKALLLEDSLLRSTFQGYIKTDIPLMTLPSDFLFSVN